MRPPLRPGNDGRNMKRKMFLAAAAMHVSSPAYAGQTADGAEADFRWGAASASYQIEGAVAADGKGKSIWDEYLDDRSLAGPGVSGAVAINFYDRSQYLKDIALMKAMGINSYRFSISWPRIIPDGLGPVNRAGVDHYRQFIADLKAAGIKPMLTLYHWDMPASLARAGGWESRASIDWFKRYADVVFANFSDVVDTFVLVNEPSVERATKIMAENRMKGETGHIAIIPGPNDLGGALKTFNHILLASAAAKKSFDAHGYHGQLGLAVPLFPTLIGDGATAADRTAARLADGVLNRWFLDAMYKGAYPADVLDVASKQKLDIDVQPDDARMIGEAHFDYLGINFYAPLFVRQAGGQTATYAPEMFLPEGTYAAFNGAVRPDQFRALFDRIRTEYGNPPIYVTENGAGFPGEDVLKNGQVEDSERCRYLIDHIAAMRGAMAAGSDVRGYHVWSSHDNLEWLSGYGSRFGMIYVDFDTQQRTPKRSATIYARLITGETVRPVACGK